MTNFSSKKFSIGYFHKIAHYIVRCGAFFLLVDGLGWCKMEGVCQVSQSQKEWMEAGAPFALCKWIWLGVMGLVMARARVFTWHGYGLGRRLTRFIHHLVALFH